VFSYQKTLKKKISISGIGLHSGQPVKINLVPSDPNTGINFIYKKQKIKAIWNNAIVSQLCTKLEKNNIILSTIEHLMASLSGLGITNLIIETSSSEIPILDGSAQEFVDTFKETGFINQEKKIKILKIKKKIIFSKDDKYIEILPSTSKNLIIDYTINYKDELIKKQNLVYEHNQENFLNIYKARTFCLHEDLEKIFAAGLGKGGSLENAIVVSGNKILNQGGLRYKNEFVKHKILDCIGDVYLSGYQIWGKIKTLSGGHETNLMLLKEVFSDNNNYDLVEFN